MKENYQDAYRLIRASEGGYSNRSKEADPGGATMYGVTQATYNAYRTRKGLTMQPVRGISEEETAEIYYDQYARHVSFNKLPSGVDYMMFDFAIHSGAGQAKKQLQKFLGVNADGVLGMQTMAALEKRYSKSPTQFIAAFADHRLTFLQTLRNWKHNKNGWTNRINHVRKHAMRMIKGEDARPQDYTDEYVGTDKGFGEQTVSASIKSSTRSQAAALGGMGTVTAAVGEAVSMVEPVKEAFAWSKYVQIIGLVLAAAAFAYIIYHRSKSNGLDS